MTPQLAPVHETMLQRCSRLLTAAHASGERSAFFVPGRIEVLGKHTDYAGGRSLLCAAEQGFVAMAAPRSDLLIRVTDSADGEGCEVAIDPDVAGTPGHWSSYVVASVRRLARNFPAARHGADIAFMSNLPRAAGMSSSSAFITALFLVFDSVNGVSSSAQFRETIRSREELAGYLGAVENGATFGSLAGDQGVGTFGGSEDHTAIICCMRDHLSAYSFLPVRPEGVIPFQPHLSFVVAVSGIAADKGSAAQGRYNELAAATARILSLWNAETGRRDTSLATAMESTPDAPQRARSILNEEHLLRRFNQFVAESLEIVPAARDAFQRGDLGRFGSLVDRSQRAAEDLLGNQTAETSALARIARENGAYAASAFGAGFGGSVWALVNSSEAGSFAAEWHDRYAADFPRAAVDSRFLMTRPGPAASSIGA